MPDWSKWQNCTWLLNWLKLNLTATTLIYANGTEITVAAGTEFATVNIEIMYKLIIAHMDHIIGQCIQKMNIIRECYGIYKQSLMQINLP